MNAENNETALGACAAGAVDLKRGSAQGTRAAVLIVSGSDFDVTRLTKHLVEANCGAASVALLSFGEIFPNGTPNGTPIDYPSTCALIWNHIRRCDWAHDSGGRSSDLPAVLAETITEMGREMKTSSAVARPGGAAYFDCDDHSSTRNVSNPITVMIASGRDSFLKVLLPRLASEQDIKVLGDPVADPVLLPMCLEQRLPKLLLLDKALLDRLGPQSLRMIHTRFSGVRVLLLWDEVWCGSVEDILRNHFHGFLLTSCPPDACVKAIRAVSRGEFWLPRGLLAKAISDPLRPPDHGDARGDRLHADANDILTRRETQIVKLLRQGFTNKEIARQLGIMEDTVKKHLQSVFGKLGVHRRTLVVLRQLAGQANIA